MDFPTDEQLITKIQHGDDGSSFEQLYWRYQHRVVSVAFGILRNKEDALEVAQESFVRVHRNISKFDPSTKFYTWLYRITVNLSIDVIRHRKRSNEVELNQDFQPNSTEAVDSPLSPVRLGVNPAQVYLQKELRTQLEFALNTLSEKHRTILVLREIEELSYAEIAEVLDISIGTVMSRLHNARLNLQSVLGNYLKLGKTCAQA